MKIPFLRHFNPTTQLFAAYTLYFTGGLIAILIVKLMAGIIWNMDGEQLETLGSGSEVSTEINRIYVVLASFLVALAPATIFRRYMEFEGQDYLRTRKAPLLKTTGILLLLLLGCIVASNFLTYVNHLLDPSTISSGFGDTIKEAQKESVKAQLALLIDPSPWIFLLNIGCYAVLAAIGEELFYRGVVQRLFVKMLRSPHAAIVITSLIFALMHFDFYGFIYRFFMGLVLGYIYLCTGNIWYSIVFHFVNNAIPIVFYWLLAHGYDWISIIDFGISGNGRWVGLAILAGLTFFAFTQINKYIRRDFVQEMRDY